MERRRLVRNEPSGPVEVAVLGEGHECMIGQVLDESKHGLGLRLPTSVMLGTPIKIESPDGMILGEVSYCAREMRIDEKGQTAGFRVGVVVKHRLPCLSELQRLNDALRAETPPISQPQPVSAIMER
jgi:hypothetical protein